MKTLLENMTAASTAQALDRHELERRLTAEVARLLECGEDDNNNGIQGELTWLGSRADLMEALHVAFSTGLLMDEQGCCLSFSAIVARACRVLHVAVPTNPYELARRATQRKGLRKLPFMERYAWMVQRGGEAPLWRHINGLYTTGNGMTRTFFTTTN